MNRSEFTSLPLSVALGLIFDVASSRLRDMPVPKVPGPPKYDGRNYRKGGFVWLSEMTLDDLRYWHKRKADSAEAGGPYAEKDEKAARAMSYWVAWRECYPDAVWRGERDRAPVTAAPPSRDPQLHNSQPAAANEPSRDYALDDETSEATAEAEASQYDL